MENVMENKAKSKIAQILKNNQKWPILICGATSDIFSKSVVIPATISTTQLGMYTDDNGTLCPQWAIDLKNTSQKTEKVILCIDNLDSVEYVEQEKFCGLLKNKGINGFSFPQNVQIVATAKDLSKISEKIKSLTIFFEI